VGKISPPDEQAKRTLFSGVHEEMLKMKKNEVIS